MEAVGQYLRRLIMPLSQDKVRLRSCLLKIIDDSFNEEFWRDDSNYSRFVDKTRGKFPDVVYSSITWKDLVPFLQHIMLVLGKYLTELDFTMCRTIQESMVKTKLLDDGTDEMSLRMNCRRLMTRIINDIMPAQPLSLRMAEEYVITAM